jgi:hypothetical protein
LLDGFLFSGFDPSFDSVFDAFRTVFDGIVVPYNPVKSRRHGSAEPAGDDDGLISSDPAFGHSYFFC